MDSDGTDIVAASAPTISMSMRTMTVATVDSVALSFSSMKGALTGKVRHLFPSKPQKVGGVDAHVKLGVIDSRGGPALSGALLRQEVRRTDQSWLTFPRRLPNRPLRRRCPFDRRLALAAPCAGEKCPRLC